VVTWIPFVGTLLTIGFFISIFPLHMRDYARHTAYYLAFRQAKWKTTRMKQLTKAPAFGPLTAATETAIDDHQTAALIDAASYRHGSRQAALRSQFEAAATEIRAQFLAGVARLQAGEGEAA
jgi:hypothetical protein